MDTSEQYIKMCEKAEEIRGRFYQVGDYIYTGEFINGGIIIYPFIAVVGQVDKYIWLPRQDQLQEMVLHFHTQYEIEDPQWFNSFRDFAVYWHHKLNSMEQLWLAFVMSERHYKIWNGEDWVAIIPSI